MVVKTISREMFWKPKVSCLPKQEKGDSYTNTPSFHAHRRTAACHHQHAAACPHRFIIQVDSNDRVGTQPGRFLPHLPQSRVFGLAQDLFIRTRTPAEEIPQSGKKVAHRVRADDSLTCHHTVILRNMLALHKGCSRQQQNIV